MAFKIPSLQDLITGAPGDVNNALYRGAKSVQKEGGNLGSAIGKGWESLVGIDAERAAKAKDQEAAAAQAKAQGIWDGVLAPMQTSIKSDSYKDLGGYQNTLLQDLADLSYSEDPLERAIAAQISGDSALQGIKTDERLTQEQYGALDALKELSKGGLNEQDRANLAKIQTQEGVADRGRREAIQQNMAARGFSGSGQDLLAQLASGQSATDRASQRGMDVAAMAEQRALDAIMKGSNLAGSMQAQQFGQEAQKAAAADELRRFNAANQQQVNLTNMSAANERAARVAQAAMDAGKYNQTRTMGVNQYNTGLTNTKAQDDAIRAQRLAEQNVGVRNEDKYRNADYKQRDFENVMNIAAGKTGQYNAAANRASATADREAGAASAIRGALIGGAATGAAAYAGKK